MKKLIFIFAAMMTFGLISCTEGSSSSKQSSADSDTTVVDSVDTDSSVVDSLH